MNARARRQPPKHVTDAHGQIHALHQRLVEAGVVCSFTDAPSVTLLIGTDGGGVVTVGLAGRRPGWWATSTTGTDLTARPGQSLTEVVDAELLRRTRSADAEYRSDIYQQTAWPSARQDAEPARERPQNRRGRGGGGPVMHGITITATTARRPVGV